MYKSFKQDKKLKKNTFKNQVVSKYSLEMENKDMFQNYTKSKPKKKMPSNDTIFGTTPLNKKNKYKKKNKLKSAHSLGKVKMSAFKF